jgi:hypothetical protein
MATYSSLCKHSKSIGMVAAFRTGANNFGGVEVVHVYIF